MTAGGTGLGGVMLTDVQTAEGIILILNSSDSLDSELDGGT